MPVFNRLELTQRMLRCLREQQLSEPVEIVIVDDGSTDGTADYLAAQADVTTLKGNGSLWWGGAIQVGLDYALGKGRLDDWVAFVNNDTEVGSDFLEILLLAGREVPRSAIGSVIRNLEPPHQPLSIGATVDPWRIVTGDRIEEWTQRQELIPVDALSGRGVLYPLEALKVVGGMRPSRLPHYLADYELALRVRRAGWRLFVNAKAAVYSHEDYGNARPMASLTERLFSVRSPSYLPAVMSFWWEASSWPQRLTLPLRAILFLLFPGLRKSR